MKFSEIPGQEAAKAALRRPVETGQLPHALMISGPPGVGKMMLARAFAQYVHCENPRGGEPCGVCNSCRMHQELNHPDLKFIFPINKKDKRELTADVNEEVLQMLREHPTMPEEIWQQIIEAGNSQLGIFVHEAAEIVRSDAMAPYAAKYKIFIIWEAEKMNADTANKLLKVIEEPSESTLFVLVSNNELQVLPTIFSRVQRIQAGRLSNADIEQYLRRRYGYSEADAVRMAPVCEGSLLRADEIGENSAEAEEFLKLYQEIMRTAYAKRVAMLRTIAEKMPSFGREKLKRFLNYMARMIRENFIFNLHMPQLNALSPEEEEFSTRFSPFVNHLNVEDFLNETDRARRDIERNGNPKIVLFDYFIQIIILLHRKPKN